jgi:uncharacterized protein (DUF2344 family)
MNTPKKRQYKYTVMIYEQPHEYEIKASTSSEAELEAVERHNGGNWDSIYETEAFKH